MRRTVFSENAEHTGSAAGTEERDRFVPGNGAARVFWLKFCMGISQEDIILQDSFLWFTFAEIMDCFPD